MSRTHEDRKAETHERLLDAAADHFARFGFDGVSTDALAEAAGRTSGALYSHFGSKEGLLMALLARWESDTSDAMRTALDSEADLEGRVRALWHTLTGSSSTTTPGDKATSGDSSATLRADGPDGLLLEHELWLYAARHPQVAERLARRYATARHTTAQSIREWADEAGIEPDPDAEASATLIMALLLGLEMQHRLDPGSVTDDVAITGLRLLMGG